MAVLQGELNLLLELGRYLIVAVHHVSVALGGLDQVLNLLGRNASPKEISTDRSRDAENYTSAYTASSDDP